MPEMTPSQMVQALPVLLKKRRVPMIWGSPGIGKTDVINQIAKSMNREVVDFRLAMRDPTAIQGFPMPDQKSKTMIFYKDAELPTAGDGILFLDEIVNAPQATQLAAMQLTLTGRIGSYVLPPGWSIVAAGNREKDRTTVHRMPSALALRMVHIDATVNLDDWVDWAIDHDISTDIIAFMRFRPNLLNDFQSSERSSPTPRGWAFVDEIYKENVDSGIEFNLIAGTVGEGAAGEFSAFVKIIKDLPTVDEVLMNADKVKVPESPSQQYAMVTSLGMAAEPNNYGRLSKFVNRMPVEFQVVFNRDAIRRQENIKTVKEFTDWAIKNSKVLK